MSLNFKFLYKSLQQTCPIGRRLTVTTTTCIIPSDHFVKTEGEKKNPYLNTFQSAVTSFQPLSAVLHPQEVMDQNFSPTKLEYYEDTWKLESTATVISSSLDEDGRHVMILDSTIFHPQGGGQPADTGSITSSGFKFVVQDVRSKDKVVYHYGVFENSADTALETKDVKGGAKVILHVDEERRKLNSRLHSAGHLLDICMRTIGLGHLEPSKGYHFSDGPFVEYKGTVSPNELQTKRLELEQEAKKLIATGGKVFVSVLSYDEAAGLCGGSLPHYIPQGSTPRIVKIGENPGCPCGGTHVSDVSEILSLKVSQIRTKKGITKVFYNLE